MRRKPKTEAKELAAVQPPKIIPEVRVQAPDKISVSSNLKAFQQELTKYLDSVPLDPQTDDDFAQADAAVKVLKAAEQALDMAQDTICASIPDVQAALAQVAAVRQQASEPRLALDKLLTKAKKDRKQRILDNAAAELESKLCELGYDDYPFVGPDFAGAVKGKRTLAGCTEACQAEIKKVLSDYADLDKRRKANLQILERMAGDTAGALVPDIDSVVFKDSADFATLVASRMAAAAQSAPVYAQAAVEESEGLPHAANDEWPEPAPEWEEVPPEEDEFPEWSAEDEQTYVEYTEEQSAQPLGPPVPGRNARDLVAHLSAIWGTDPQSVVLWLGSEHFMMDLVDLEQELGIA